MRKSASFGAWDGQGLFNEQLFKILFLPHYSIVGKGQALFTSQYSSPALKIELIISSWISLRCIITSECFRSNLFMFSANLCGEEVLSSFFKYETEILRN